jgi:hypothetical protein
MNLNKLQLPLAMVLWLAFSVSVKAAPPMPESPLPASLAAGLNHLIKVVHSDEKQAFDLSRIEALLDFIGQPVSANELLYSTKTPDMPSAYYSFDVAASLARIIQYAYNPEIPAVVARPSSVRLAHWTEVEKKPAPLPKLWEALPNLSSPIIVHGIEYVENTPDLNSGAYFGYDLDRALILCRHRGKNLLISLSHQKQVSDVGRKGWILGSDQEWNYLYSGEKGINKPGMGWADAYMYDSYTVAIYLEVEASPSAPLTRCGTVQWLRAGWAGMNLVKRSHIYRGMDRFARDFKQIMENPNLPAVDELAAQFAQYEQMPAEVLREKTRQHLRLLNERYGHDDRQVADYLTADRSSENLTKEQMAANLVKEHTKLLLGKEIPHQASYLIGARKPPASGMQVQSQ